jgi:beta-lactamase regulating signal transducer with metallopeptidase domain
MTSLVEVGLSNAAAALLIAIVAVLVGLACRRPALMHALWLLVLIKLVTPPLVRIPVPWGAPPAEETAPAPEPDVAQRLAQLLEEPPDADVPEAEEAPEDAEAPAVVVNVSADEADEPAAAAPPLITNWPAVIGGVWLVGSAAWFLLAGRRLWRFGRLLRLGRPAPRALTRRVERLAARVGLASCPAVLLLPGRLAPMVWGVDDPLLLLPEGLPEEVTPEALDTLLLHELAHLRRRDHLVRLLEFVAMGLYWWLPVVWYARRELREAEEQCCDAWVVGTLPGSGRLYASAIVDALDFLSPETQPVPPLASGLGQVADLKRRLTMILRGSIPHQLGWSASLVVLALAALLLPLVPSFAQEPAKNKYIVAQGPGGDDLERMERDLKRRMEEIESLRRKMEETRRAQREGDARKRAEEAERRRGEEGRRRGEDAARDARKKAEEAIRKAETILKEKLKALDRMELKDLNKLKEIKNLKDLEKIKAQKKSAQGGPGNVVIRIEISGLHEGVKEVIDKIQKVLPKDSRVTLNVQGSRSIRAPLTITVPGVNPVPRVETKPAPPPLPAQPAPRAGGSRSGDERRLDSLERRLEGIMRELESLRREMRRPGGGAGTPGREKERLRDTLSR